MERPSLSKRLLGRRSTFGRWVRNNLSVQFGVPRILCLERLETRTVLAAPQMFAMMPRDNSVDVPVETNLVMKFDQPVLRGDGGLAIVKSSDNSIVKTIPVSDIAIGANWASFAVTNLEESTEYHVMAMPSPVRGVFTSLNGENFVGLSSSSDWNFTTANHAGPWSVTMVVNSLDDRPDAYVGDGLALDASGYTTLRAALMEARYIYAPVQIQVPAGIYNLVTAGQEEDNSELGDLDIATNVTINGDNAQSTIIDGGGLDRVFDVLPFATTKLSNLTIRNGDAIFGGGVRNQGVLTLDNVHLTDNHASYGGALDNEGFTSITHSSFLLNSAHYWAGAIYNNSAVLDAQNSTIGDNYTGDVTTTITGIGGGLLNFNLGSVTLTNVTIHANRSQNYGGLVSLSASTTLKNSIVAGNFGQSRPDLLFSGNSSCLSLGHNLIGTPDEDSCFVNGNNGDQVGSLSAPLDPHLGPSGTYGGSTTVYPLLANSTAIDHGDNSGATLTDQLGKARIIDGDADGIDVIDIGAVEFVSTTFIVNSIDDRRDVNLGDGNALDSTGHTTLRAAIMEANALHVPVKIQIPAGVYRFTRSGRDEDTSVSGDLDITDRITIIGDDAQTTIIDATGLDRVFDVLPGAKTLLSQLTIRNGDVTFGGGIRNQGTLVLDKVNLTDNRANIGGAIYATGPTSITNSSLVTNFASIGAAFYNQGAVLTALNSTIGNNLASSAGGGLVSDSGGTVTLTSVTVYANSAPSTGGLAALNSSTIKLKNSIVAGNLGGNYPDLYSASASFLSLGHNLVGNPADVPGFVNGINGDQVGSGSQLLNPHLGSSGTYGGSTVIYPLLASSPAIDHGDNAGAPTTDQSGKARITDGDDDGVDVIDIGAVELAVQTFVVNSLDDLPDAFLGDGLAVDFTGHTTLRAAIMEANAIQGHTRILVPAGNYVLIYTGQGDDTAAYGDLDIATSITIVGADAKSTIIDGGGWDRIFHVLPDATAKLSNLTVRNGSNNYGGGVLNQGTLELDRVNLTENHASTGGAIYSVGLTSISNSSLIKNFANNAGAVYNYAAKFTASNSTIGENEASSFAGGLASENGTNVTLTNVTIYANRAPSAGGLAAGYSDTVSLKNSIVAGNLGGNYPDLFSSYSTYISLGHNLIGNPADVPAFVNGTNGDQVGSNTLPLNPHLGSSGTYGGSTVVYPLLASSPAIDQGDNAGASITDQSGKARITDGDDDGTDVIDIGSVEYVSPTMVVNSFEDNPDVLPGDGFALDFSGHTTLRAAIMEANSRQGPVKIRVPAGIYTLTVNGRDEDMSVLGDMDLATNVKIVGDDAKTTIIDGNGLDRIFHVLPGAKADISKLTMRHGDVRHYSDKGGGVFNQGNLTLDSVVLIENRATYGGAILSEGVVTITGSSLIKNNAFVAGAFYNSGGVLTALNSTVGENQASSGGAMLIDNGKVELTNVTIYANESSAAGGLAAFNTSTITLRNSIVAGNLGGDYPDLYNLNSRYQSLGHNLIGNPANVFGFVNGTLGDQVGSGLFPIDPHLGASGTYGGSTVIYPLLARSTAIDHGDPIGATATDQSGKARVMDGDDDGANIIDIGAVEFTSQTIIVNSLDDYPDMHPGDGLALDVSGHTTLRAAIMEANTREVPVKVRVPAGIYVLANTGQEDDMSAMGDLDIATNVKIIGADAKTTIIDGGGAYRVFHVLPGASAELSNLTIRNGYAWFSEGGGVRNQGTLALDKVNLTDNRANVGGAIYTDGLTTISSSSFVRNVANIAGAIQNDAAVLTITNSTIGDNIANNGGGGLVTDHGGNVTLFSVTVYANSASIAGGLAVLGTSTITARNSIVAGNIGGIYPDLYNENSSYLSLGHNLIGNPADVLGFINGINGDLVGNSFSQLNPRLGSAGTYGGSTTIYPLLPDSLAIDQGDNTGATAIDQSGKNRIIDGDEDGLDIIDIGAAEFEQWTLVVDSFDDHPDAFLGDGHALDANGHTTLRAAIMEANALHVQTKIQVPAGNYIHSYTGLDIATSITIVGEDAKSTIINGGGWDRVFHIESGANAKLSNLTIRNGYATQGGGILNQGTLVLDKVNLTDNRANTGGAIYSVGPTSITNSSLVKNFAGVAGAVFNHGVNLTASNSTIGENIATDRGGGLVNQNGGEVTLINVTVYANRAPEAGGIATFNTGVVSLRNSIVAGNFGGYHADLYNVNASYVSLGHNLIGNPADVSGFINGVQGDLVGTYYAPLDPQLGPSGIYNGSTVVYPPVAGSQAIDHGDNEGATSADQSGNIRVLDGDNDDTEVIDIGAVEFVSPTIIVNSLDDFPDAAPGDGLSLDVTGHTTLRAAIMEANTRQVQVRIFVPAGIYQLTLSGHEDASAQGDLDIHSWVKIIGDDASTTIIDGGGLDSVFQVLPSGHAELSNLTIRNGLASLGGGVRNQGTLALDNVNLTANYAETGGALFTTGLTTITDSSLVNNYAYLAGAVYNNAARFTAINITIGENQASSAGGGLVTENGGDVTLTNVTVYANKAPVKGGLSAGYARIQLSNSIVAGNSGGSYPDLYNYNSTYQSLGHNLIGNPADVLGFINGLNGDQVGSYNLPLDPHLGPFGSYGGSTVVYPVLVNSTAIDHGDNDRAPATDQSGKARIIDGDVNGIDIVDIGAVEFVPWTFVVDSLEDRPDLYLGDGFAIDATGHTTLRAAIMEANSLKVPVQIQIPAGIYKLSRSGTEEDKAALGDLDLATDVKIVGADARTTIIDGAGLDRVFHVLPSVRALISQLTIRNGNATLGGGVRNQGTLTLNNIHLTANHAGTGGALYSEGSTSVLNSSFVKNFASVAGGIFSSATTFTALNSTIGENIASDSVGGIAIANQGDAELTNVTVYANRSQSIGGLAGGYTTISLRNSIVAGNVGGINPDVYSIESTFQSLGHNFIGNPSDVIGFVNGINGDQVGNYYLPLAPNLGSPETYGGSTVVYPPLTNSTAIDHGDNINATLTDQSGKARITDGDEDGISVIDIGAVEFKLVNHRPRITSTATPSVSENTTDVLTIVAIDSDLPAQVISFAITGGDDQSKFSITPTGILSFVTPPVLSHPTDSNFDNVYIVQVTASDGQGGSTNQTLAVKVVDVTAPTLTELSPPDNSDDVRKNANLVLTFFEPVLLGTGNIVIRNSSDNSVFQTIDVVDVTRVAIGGSTVTVDPNDFDPGVSYYVEISPGAFKDLSGNSFAGIAGTTTWDFTVAKVALFDVAGTTLLLDLNSPNTNLSIMADGSAYKLTLTGSYWSGTDSAAVVGNKTSMLTLTPTGLLNIDKIIVNDSAIGGSVTFADSGTSVYSDDFSVILDQLGAGAIEFNGKTTFTGAKNLAVSTTSSIQLANGSSLATTSGNLTFKAAVVEANSTTIASLLGSITLNANSINFSGTTALQTTGSAVIAPLTAGTLINLGGTDAPGVLGLTDAELDRIATSRLTIGDPSSGTITISAAITSDNQLSLINGDGGILSGGGSLGTNGNSITLNTSGTIGASSNRLLIADQPDVTRQRIIVGDSLSPNSIYLGGLGSLTLGSIAGESANVKIDITATQHLFVSGGSTINSGTNTVSLKADIVPSGTGEDGVGTLTIGDGASVYGGEISLTGADEDISATSNVGGIPLCATLSLTGVTGIGAAYAVAFDDHGNLFVANYLDNTVSKFIPGALTSSSILTGLNRPHALAFDHSGNLFVANRNGTTVSMFAPGQTTPTATLTGLNQPYALAFDESGSLFVANVGNNTVSKFLPGALTPNVTLGQLQTPTALAFDTVGNLFVANQSGNTVSMFAPGTDTPSRTLSGLLNPAALAFDSDGNLFVASLGAGTVSKIPPGSTEASVVYAGMSLPSALAFDAKGELFIANKGSGTIGKIVKGSSTALPVVTGVRGPISLAFDSQGYLFIASSGFNVNATVYKVAPWISSTLSATIQPSVAERIDLGTNSDTNFGLTDAELDRFVSKEIFIGGKDAVEIVFSAPITANTPLKLNSTNSITQSFSGTALGGGATLLLKGNLAPGSDDHGNFVIDGNLSFDKSAGFKVDIDGTSAFDQLVVTGSAHVTTLSEAALLVTLKSAPSVGNVFKIIDSTGTGSSVIGNFTFNGVTIINGDTINVGNTHLRVDYNPALGPGDVTLTVVSQALLLSASRINENADTSQTVGSLSLAEPFTGSTSFSLVSGVGASGNSNFVIDVNGNLKTSKVFNYEAQSSYSIRVRATNSAGQTEQTFTISVIDLPELTGLPIIGDGTNQRSFVNKVTLLLDALVTIDAGAFTLVKRDTGEVVVTQATQSQSSSGQTQLIMTFSGSLTRGGGALSDGYYQLTIDGSKIRRGNSQADFNTDGTGGDSLIIGATESDNFFALYGDTNGDGQVGIAEFGEFRAAFGKTSQDAGYNLLFDYEQDLAIGIGDFGQFRSRFGKAKLKF